MRTHGPIKRRDIGANNGGTAVIVTCHNYARFLGACLDSLLSQTRGFEHILVVDDASTDDTEQVVARYHGVKYLRTEHRDACLARRSGVAALPRTRWLVFMDADNYLAPDWHNKLRRVMDDPRLGVAYPRVHMFEDGTGAHMGDLAQPYSYNQLRRHNYVDTCALVRYEAYAQAGGWEQVGGLQDWLLWLRITSLGWTMRLVPEALLYYRNHVNSMSQQRIANRMDEQGHVDVVSRHHTVTIITLFSGRSWMLKRFSRALLALHWPRENLHIVAIDNSRDWWFGQKLKWALDQTGIAYTLQKDKREAIVDERASDVCDSAKLRIKHGFAINEHIAYLYARARMLMPVSTDYVWCLEDDIEPPPDTLIHFARGFIRHSDADVICGACVNRFGKLTGAHRLIAWWGNFSDPMVRDFPRHLYVPPPRGTFAPITGSGFMCTAFRREMWDSLAFRPSPFWNHDRHYYDWAAAHEVQRQGRGWYISGDVLVKHWQRDGTYLYPLENTATPSGLPDTYPYYESEQTYPSYPSGPAYPGSEAGPTYRPPYSEEV